MSKSSGRWQEIESQFTSLLNSKESFDEFFELARQLFEARAQSYTGTRKPPINLRLLSHDGNYRVCISPSWDSRFYQIGSKIRIEVMRQELLDTGLYHFRKAMTVMVSESTLKLCSVYSKHLVNATDAMASVFTEFIKDPESVLARDSNHCACCGRALTDGTSRARGVGPECVTHLWMFGFKKPVISASELFATT